MIVATYRDQEVRQSPRLAELFGLLGREGSSIPPSRVKRPKR